MSARVLTVLLHRRLDAASSGSAAYLTLFLQKARASGFRIRLVFAPRRSFGALPSATVHRAFAALADDVVWPGALRLGRRYVSTSPKVWGGFLRRLLREAAARAPLRRRRGPKVASLLGHPLEPREARRLADAANASPSDLVVAEYSAIAPVLSDCLAVRRAVLMHDVFSLRARSFRAAGVEPDHAAPSVLEEARACAAADALVYASMNELTAFAPLLPGRRHVWLRPEATPRPPARGAQGPPRAVFIGALHGGNLDALALLLDQIWPLVRSQAPLGRLLVAGSIGRAVPRRLRKGAGVEVLGPVADLGSLGGPESVGVAPIRAASGVSIKIVDYLSLGMAALALPEALSGFGGTLDDLVEVAPDPPSFAQRLAVLLTDDEARRRRAARGRAEVGARLTNREIADFLTGV